MSRQMGDVEWQWGTSEQLSFELIRDKAAEVTDMHGHNFRLPVKMFSDPRKYGGGCLITQHLDKKDGPILFDSFLFTKTQRNYVTYKRELLTIVEFC